MQKINRSLNGTPRHSAAAWPPSFSALALVGALLCAAVAGSLLLTITSAFTGTGQTSSPAATLAGTLIQDVIFVAVPVWLGYRVSSATAADLGFRPAPWRLVLSVSVVLGIAFAVSSVLYDLVVGPEGRQDTLDALGVDRGDLWLVLTGVLVVGMAPFAEEVLFRGFMYRCLRNRYSAGTSSAVIGVVFGAIHFDGPDVLTLLPVLAVFGAVLSMAYERAGTLYAPILLHAINNAISFVALGPDGAVWVAGATLAVTLGICAFGIGVTKKVGSSAAAVP